ncbi:hypothetical protein CI102_2380 [Trichoderma harzianum]|nr:hypothetical protein CI102_2380 [Trichoderma harzianum]
MSNNWPGSPNSHGGSPLGPMGAYPGCEICQGRGWYTLEVQYWRERQCDYAVGHCTIYGHTSGCQQRFIESGRTQRFCPCGWCLGSGIRRELLTRIERRDCSCWTWGS